MHGFRAHRCAALRNDDGECEGGYTDADALLRPWRLLDGLDIALEETGAPYETKLVNLAQGEQTKPEYTGNVNPRGKVPALRIDDGMLTENVAILTYLARTGPLPACGERESTAAHN